MHPPVQLQLTVISVVILATLRFLVGVAAHMVCEMTLLTEARITFCTAVRCHTSVNFSVLFEITCLIESCPALLASEWFLAGVNSHVNPKGLAEAES